MFNPLPISASPPKKQSPLAAAPRSASFLEQTAAEEGLNASFSGVTALRRETQFRQLSRHFAAAVWQKLATTATKDSEGLSLDDLRVDVDSDEHAATRDDELQRSFKYED